MIIKPHYAQIIIHTLKLLSILIICFIAAFIISPNKYYTALNGAKIIIPLSVIIYAYFFYFWKSVSICINEEKLIFDMPVGRKNHVEISLSNINNVIVYQGFFDKIFGVSRIKLDVLNMERQTGSDLSVVENYLVFSSENCKNIVQVLHQTAF